MKKRLKTFQYNFKWRQKGSFLTMGQYARRMTIGFIGQYLKMLMQDPNVKEYTSKDILFYESIMQSIATRNYVMHSGMLIEATERLKETSRKHLLPWQESFEALKILLLNDNNTKHLITAKFPISYLNDACNAQEEEIRIKIVFIKSYFRLMHYVKVIEIFNSETVQVFIKDEKNSLFIKLEIYHLYILVLVVKGDFIKEQLAFSEQIKIIDKLLENYELESEDKSMLQDLKENAINHLLLMNNGLPSDTLKKDITLPGHQLVLAENYLINTRYKEAIEIINPIFNPNYV